MQWKLGAIYLVGFMYSADADGRGRTRTDADIFIFFM